MTIIRILIVPVQDGEGALPLLVLLLDLAVALPVGEAVGVEGQEGVVRRPHLVQVVDVLDVLDEVGPALEVVGVLPDELPVGVEQVLGGALVGRRNRRVLLRPLGGNSKGLKVIQKLAQNITQD